MIGEYGKVIKNNNEERAETKGNTRLDGRYSGKT